MDTILLAEKNNCSWIFIEFPALGITPLKFWNVREGGDWEDTITMRLEDMAFPADEGDHDFQISCSAWGILDLLCFPDCSKIHRCQDICLFHFLSDRERNSILGPRKALQETSLFRRRYCMSCTYYPKGRSVLPITFTWFCLVQAGFSGSQWDFNVSCC